MFVYPATEIYAPDGARRVVWSEEEFRQALASGFTEEAPKPAAEPPKRGPGRPRNVDLTGGE